jgi:hypothetical protein
MRILACFCGHSASPSGLDTVSPRIEHIGHLLCHVGLLVGGGLNLLPVRSITVQVRKSPPLPPVIMQLQQGDGFGQTSFHHCIAQCQDHNRLSKIEFRSDASP